MNYEMKKQVAAIEQSLTARQAKFNADFDAGRLRLEAGLRKRKSGKFVVASPSGTTTNGAVSEFFYGCQAKTGERLIGVQEDLQDIAIDLCQKIEQGYKAAYATIKALRCSDLESVSNVCRKILDDTSLEKASTELSGYSDDDFRSMLEYLDQRYRCFKVDTQDLLVDISTIDTYKHHYAGRQSTQFDGKDALVRRVVSNVVRFFVDLNDVFPVFEKHHAMTMFLDDILRTEINKLRSYVAVHCSATVKIDARSIL
jgi:hypothetical protein